MGKDGFLTPKAIANRIKSKGLQKLKFYCQMCQKQCRDENGFKCHITSESHQRQLLLFAENPDDFLGTYSQEFRDGYLELLRRRFGTKRVRGNQVYQEYINDKDHVHMNSTQWETLTEFIKWLGREGLCVVDETEKGWFVQYIDRDPETLKRQEALKSKEKMEKDDEERTAAFIQAQVEKAKLAAADLPEVKPTALERENPDKKLAFSMGSKPSTSAAAASTIKPTAVTNPLLQKPEVKPSKKEAGKKRKSALDEIMELEEKKKKRAEEETCRKENWLFPDIIVKITTKKLGDKYYKKKGTILEVMNKYTAIVKLTATGDKLKLDQTHLETVLPATDKSVLIVNGPHRGEEAVLVKLNEEKFSCNVRMSTGPFKGKIVENVQYEDLSKLHVSLCDKR